MGCGQTRADDIKSLNTHSRVTSERLLIQPVEHISDYEILESLHSSPTSEFLRCIHTPSQKVRVIEKFTKTERSLTAVKAYQELEHPSIVKPIEIIEDFEHYYVVQEQVEGENLLSRMNQLIESDCAVILFQLLSALDFCHSRYIVHRNVTSETVFFTSHDTFNLEIKLCHFGDACYLDQRRRASLPMKPSNCPPPELELGFYNEKVDIWSCGLILHTLLSKKAPEDENEIRGRLIEGATMDCMKFVNALLQRDYKARSSTQVALSNPWIIKSKSSKLALASCTNLIKLNLNTLLNFKELIVKYIVSYIIDKDQLERYKLIFNEIDIDKDGEVSYRELTSYYEAKQHKKNKEFLKAVERSFTGNLDIYKFVQAALGDAEIISRKVLKKTFTSLDEDSDGFISAWEIRSKLNLDEEVSDNVWTQIVNEVNIEENGGISFEQFVRIMAVEH